MATAGPADQYGVAVLYECGCFVWGNRFHGQGRVSISVELHASSPAEDGRALGKEGRRTLMQILGVEDPLLRDRGG